MTQTFEWQRTSLESRVLLPVRQSSPSQTTHRKSEKHRRNMVTYTEYNRESHIQHTQILYERKHSNESYMSWSAAAGSVVCHDGQTFK